MATKAARKAKRSWSAAKRASFEAERALKRQREERLARMTPKERAAYEKAEKKRLRLRAERIRARLAEEERREKEAAESGEDRPFQTFKVGWDSVPGKGEGTSE